MTGPVRAADRPIIFSVPMLHAVLAGRKTRTRRMIHSPHARCRPGDRLWVREGFAPLGRVGGRWVSVGPGEADHILLRDGTWRARHDAVPAPDDRDLDWRWWPPIHMPRWASRLTLTVETVHREPLRAITPADAIAEGLEAWPFGLPLLWRAPGAHWSRPRRSPVTAWRERWDRLHGPGERWADNPAVVVLGFRVEPVAPPAAPPLP